MALGVYSVPTRAATKVSSPSLAQTPLLVLLHSKVESVPDSKELLIAPKNPLNARTATEFKKTAAAIRKNPWCLHNGAKYLEDLVDPDRQTGAPPNVSAIFTGFGGGHDLEPRPLPDVADIFAPGPPRTFPVTIIPG